MSDTNAANEEMFIGRQPILDRSQNLVAYELLFRSGTRNVATIQDDLIATASVINHAFTELGIEQALGPYKGFINCNAAMLQSDLPELLPADKIVLEILETVEVTPELVARCAELKARGFALALDDFVDDVQKWEALLGIVDIIKVDLPMLDDAALAASTAILKRRPLRLLAEKVDTRDQAEYCLSLGYDLFQGYYFAKPTIIAGHKLSQSQVALMQLMALIMNDAETAELEAAFKHHPGLAMNILRLTNSVATGVRMKITSLRHAITVLGRRQLQRWLQLVLYSNPNNGSITSPLMHLAATRGRLLELLAAKRKPGNHGFEDHAFMTGIMSLMPALMNVPMEEILQGVNLDPAVILGLTHRQGDLGFLLQLAEVLESGDGETCSMLCHQAGLLAETVNTCLAQALAWAGSISQENPVSNN